jgi:UDP-2,3-diacylglucosamine pyrophosphatase LpxH
MACKYGAIASPSIDSMSSRQASRHTGISKSAINNHRSGTCPCTTEKTLTASASGESETHRPDGTADYVRFSERPWGYEDYRQFIRSVGQDPDKVTFTWGWTSNPNGGAWNKLNNVRPITDSVTSDPAWPVIQRAEPVNVVGMNRPLKPIRAMKLALKGADTQIGFRLLPSGAMDSFHDDAAMDCFIQAALELQPDKIQILGDFLDLASQGRFAQEAAFANTTQAALNTGHKFLAELREACPSAEMIIIEGNHDKRMQNFIEANAVAAFGLKRAGLPESWPVMSLPYLLRLDELNIRYVDAYPAATDWDNDTTRNIHGTKANAKGSTTAQYVHEVPHLNTWAGHTHRTEITYHSVIGPRGERIESYSANPGCLCRVDGAVPSVKGAISADGTPARIVENWHQGFGLAYYNDTESWPFVYRIRNGVALIGGMELSAA